jgi:hypothetical protein
MEWAELATSWGYRCVADDSIGTTRVVTIWQGFYPYGKNTDDDPIFSSIEIRTVGDVTTYATEEWYATEAEALAGHAARIARIIAGAS